MKKIMIAIGCCFLLCLALPVSADPPACGTTFTGAFDNIWQKNGNWDNNAPTIDTVACIPADKSVEVDNSQPVIYVAAKALVIQKDQSTAGHVVLEERTTLTIRADSYFDGHFDPDPDADPSLLLLEDASLIIKDSLTIFGDGGDIGGKTTSTSPEAMIRDDGETPTGVLTIVGVHNDDPATSLVLRQKLVVSVELVNDAYVIADVEELQLTDKRKTGTGFWRAVSGGDLHVLTEVTGSGKWELLSSSFSAIIIDGDCPSLSGDVIVEKGILDIRDTFITSGDLIFRSVGDPPSSPLISVTQDNLAQFGP